MEDNKGTQTLVNNLRTSAGWFSLLAFLGIGSGILSIIGNTQPETSRLFGFIWLGTGMVLFGVASILRGMGRVVQILADKT